MPSYNDGFKLECVGYLELLKEKGTINLIKVGTEESIQIKNVRELVKFLNISSYSIYKWYKEIQYLGRNMDLEEVKKEIEGMKDLEVLGFEGEGDAIPEGVNFYDDVDMGLPDSEIEPMTFKMGTTFFQTLAQGLGIKKYRMPLKQLYLNIGSELIKRSGLVENGVRKELRIE